jgi:hypothetical protein
MTLLVFIALLSFLYIGRGVGIRVGFAARVAWDFFLSLRHLRGLSGPSWHILGMHTISETPTTTRVFQRLCS